MEDNLLLMPTAPTTTTTKDPLISCKEEKPVVEEDLETWTLVDEPGDNQEGNKAIDETTQTEDKKDFDVAFGPPENNKNTQTNRTIDSDSDVFVISEDETASFSAVDGDASRSDKEKAIRDIQAARTLRPAAARKLKKAPSVREGEPAVRKIPVTEERDFYTMMIYTIIITSVITFILNAYQLHFQPYKDIILHKGKRIEDLESANRQLQSGLELLSKQYIQLFRIYRHIFPLEAGDPYFNCEDLSYVQCQIQVAFGPEQMEYATARYPYIKEDPYKTEATDDDLEILDIFDNSEINRSAFRDDMLHLFGATRKLRRFTDLDEEPEPIEDIPPNNERYTHKRVIHKPLREVLAELARIEAAGNKPVFVDKDGETIIVEEAKVEADDSEARSADNIVVAEEEDAKPRKSKNAVRKEKKRKEKRKYVDEEFEQINDAKSNKKAEKQKQKQKKEKKRKNGDNKRSTFDSVDSDEEIGGRRDRHNGRDDVPDPEDVNWYLERSHYRELVREAD